MSGLEILDVGIGLVFSFPVLSLMCSAANEMLAGFTSRTPLTCAFVTE